MHRVFLSPPTASELAALASLVDAGKLKLTLDRVFPFAEIGEALAYLEKVTRKAKSLLA
jgi:NADPH:quinone reductase-like Zn-dependent oxidoreductase